MDHFRFYSVYIKQRRNILIKTFLFLCLANSCTSQDQGTSEGTHHLVIDSPTNQLKLGDSLLLSAISNKNFTEFDWLSEDPHIVKVDNGMVTAVGPGDALISVKAKEDPFEAAYLITGMDTASINTHGSLAQSSSYHRAAFNQGTTYQNKGILLFPSDIDGVPEWPRIAAEAGINTIGIHPGGGHLEGILKGMEQWLSSDSYKNFIEKCKQYEIEVEYEIHAIKELLPRELFDNNPTLFRMDQQGVRHREDNFCIHSKQALELLCNNIVELAKKTIPSTGRYYFWIDDARPMCHPDKGDIYSDSEQALILENLLLRELRKIDARATVAHLAFMNTLDPPEKVKPNPGVFLEFATIHRDYSTPYSSQKTNEADEGWNHLANNLKVFPAKTSQVLEYWVDVSKWSGDRKRPFKELPWEEVSVYLDDDIEFYRSLGVAHITSFGNGLDDHYQKNYGFKLVEEYGKALSDQ